MTTLLEERLPDVSAEERAANEFARLIRKLRWMGMESGERQVRQCSTACHLGAILRASLLTGLWEVWRGLF